MNYEIHLTIDKPSSIEKFKDACSIIGVKPLVIATGDYEQVMTSSIYRGMNLMDKLKHMSEDLDRMGFNVVRQKVEIMPSIVKHPQHLYYESHIRLKILKDRSEYVMAHQKKIDRFCKSKKLHKSKNLFKIDNKFIYQMVTYRTYTDTIWQFGTHIEDCKDHMGHGGLWYDKIELEECIYDTNENIDNNWLNK